MERLVAGRYRLIEQIGRGGMGTVWRAEDTVLGREIAVKVLTARPEAHAPDQRRRYERIRREARSAAMIDHRNVVVVHDVVEDEDCQPCIVMELVRGRSLARRIADDGPLDPAEAAGIGRDVLSALRAAHGAGVLHRDVKPGNVLLGDGGTSHAEGIGGGRVVLTDFGIAVWAGASALTQSGEMVGSAGYIAPERLHGGGESGPAGDLWALGATLYCAVEGRRPFERLTALEEAYATVAEEPHPMRRAGALAPVIEGLLVKDPQARLTTEEAEQLLTASIEHVPAVLEPAALAAASPPARRDIAQLQEPRTGAARRAGFSRTQRKATAAGAGVAAIAVATLVWGVVGHAPQVRATTTPSATVSPSCGPAVTTALPAHSRWAHQLGVTVAVPAAWRAKARGDGQQVDFVDPAGRVVLRIGRTDLAGPDPVTGWQNLEKTVRRQLKDYRRLRLAATCEHGRAAAVWEFSWQASVRYRAVDLAWSDAHQNGYGVYLSAPADQWRTFQPVFDTAVATIRPG